jgi:hypothetical protein
VNKTNEQHLLIVQLRDALKLAESELQRRCVISGKITDALAAADRYLGPAK